jgi:hypothetical protein
MCFVYIPCHSGPELNLENANRNISGFFHGQDIDVGKSCDVFSVWGRCTTRSEFNMAGKRPVGVAAHVSSVGSSAFFFCNGSVRKMWEPEFPRHHAGKCQCKCVEKIVRKQEHRQRSPFCA